MNNHSPYGDRRVGMRSCSTSNSAACKRIYGIAFKVRLSPAMRKKGRIICNAYPRYSYAPGTASGGARGWVSAMRHGHPSSPGAQKFDIHSLSNSFRYRIRDAVSENVSLSNRVR
jgi:hypothetical protein